MRFLLSAPARVFCITAFVVIASCEVANAQSAASPPSTQLEEQKLDTERMKARWAAAGAVVPMVVALLTLGYSVLSLRRTVIAQFVTKAAEIALEGPGPLEAINRAKLLAALFGDMLPADFTKRFADLKPTDFGRVNNPSPAKKELLKLLAEYPSQRTQIIEDWRALFPGDTWIGDIAPPTRTS